ncbi:MAG: holo-ACP synthase [Rickettsiaceae bacterium]|nr:holo-ACP synthase [Rickettsiaceae bacterium]
MIIGIGCDIVDINRIKKLYLKYKERFISKILTSEEISHFNNLSTEKFKIYFIAKRFAAKEALAKAFGCGIGTELSFQDIIVSNNAAGAPAINLKKSPPCKDFIGKTPQIYLTISDESWTAVAFVVIELL